LFTCQSVAPEGEIAQKAAKLAGPCVLSRIFTGANLNVSKTEIEARGPVSAVKL
jgi:hypothetical protein